METLKTILLVVQMILLSVLTICAIHLSERVEVLEQRSAIQMKLLIQHEILLNWERKEPAPPPPLDKET